jgi:uncharacterized protein
MTSDTEKTSPTGTCDPFSLQLVLSPKGEIYTCLETGQEEIFGYIDKTGKLIFDFYKICNFYNTVYRKITEQCSKCFRKEHCTFCIFHLKDKNNPICPIFLNAKNNVNLLEGYIDYFEKTKKSKHSF